MHATATSRRGARLSVPLVVSPNLSTHGAGPVKRSGSRDRVDSQPASQPASQTTAVAAFLNNIIPGTWYTNYNTSCIICTSINRSIFTGLPSAAFWKSCGFLLPPGTCLLHDITVLYLSYRGYLVCTSYLVRSILTARRLHRFWPIHTEDREKKKVGVR